MDSIGKYKIIRELGAGGFGAVYLAEDPRLGEQVAIKVFRIRDENVAQQATTATGDAGEVLKGRFLNEARTLRKLQRNPHIVEVFDFDELEDGTPYYVMPYLPRSLKNELGSDATDAQVIAELDPEEKPRRLPLTQCWLYLEQLLIALKDVHKAGLIHRDIKPANLLFDEHGAVKLCDFGIAKVPDSEHSYSGIGMGSRNYMAPEQRQSAKHVDARSDIYSAGVLAYRMITGTLPEGRYADPIHYQPGLTEAQNDFILKALSQQKDDRFADGAAMLSTLRKLEGKSSRVANENTGTWVGGTDEIRTELKPLEQQIIQLLQNNGEVKDSDLPMLQALAELGGLNNNELQTLIDKIKESQANQSPQQKAFQHWVSTLSNAIERGDALSPQQCKILLNAGESATDKTEQELQYVLASKGLTIESENSSSETVNTDTEIVTNQREASSGSAGKWIGLVVSLLILAGGSYFGFDYYKQKEAESQRELTQKKKEQKAWEVAKTEDSIESYERYLRAWPSAEHNGLAREALEDLEKARKFAQMNAADKKKQLVKQAQQYLISLGYEVPENGELDQRTRKAIETFESSQKLVVAGAVDSILISNLQRVIKARDDAAWNNAVASNSSTGYQKYLDENTSGAYREEAKSAHEKALKRENDAIARAERERKEAEAIAEAKRREQLLWAAAQKTNSLEDYKAYESEFPGGQHIEQVQTRIQEIEFENNKVALKVNVTPADSEVRFIGLNKEYVPGMRLPPGSYTVELSRRGRETRRETISLSKSNSTFSYHLRGWLPDSIFALVDGMKKIPGGTFVMGCQANDPMCQETEKPAQKVNVTSFSMMENEVTVEQFAEFVAATGYKTLAETEKRIRGCSSKFHSLTDADSLSDSRNWRTADAYTAGRETVNNPVVCIAPPDIRAFIKWLNDSTGERYRLPREEEWEYAARAGSSQILGQVTTEEQLCSVANVGDSSLYNSASIMKHVACNDGYKMLAPVGRYKPNAFGLYDMTGNAFELTIGCRSSSLKINTASSRCDDYVMKGGSWADHGYYLRLSIRMFGIEKTRDDTTGFRLVKD